MTEIALIPVSRDLTEALINYRVSQCYSKTVTITHKMLPIFNQCKMLKFSAFGLILALFVLSGCATQTQQTRMNESREQFKNGNLQNSVATIQDAFKTKNTLFYLEMGQVQRLLGPSQIPNSTNSLRIADTQVEKWEVETNERLKRSLGDVSSYLLSEGVNSEYDPKLYEMSFLSQTLALNHIAQGHWNDAMVEAKKMAQREKVIEELIQRKTLAILQVEQSQQNNPATKGVTSRIEEINGYPVNLLDDEETRSLKNAYQNPSAYYLSAFIYESQGETSLAAPGYRLALELRPSIPFFKSSLANLDANIKNRNLKKTADTLVIIDTGYMPKITPYRLNQTFTIGNGPKLVTLTFPVIEKSTERFTPYSIEFGNVVVKPELVTSLDTMARKNLKDDMPAYVLRASTRALVSLAAQYAADRAVQQSSSKNNQNNNNAAIAGAIAGLLTGLILQSVNVTDVRHWSTLPAQTYMARLTLPIGPNLLRYTTPSGLGLSQTVNLVEGYNVVYIRMFRDKASVLISNDPKAVPQAIHLLGEGPSAPLKDFPAGVVLSGANDLPLVAREPKPSTEKTSFFHGLQGLMGISTDTGSELVPSSVLKPSIVTEVQDPTPNPSPSSSNIDIVNGYELPNFLNSFQQLFK